MAEAAETLSATPEPQDAAVDDPRASRGITLPALLTGFALLLMLAFALPRWTLTKNYPMGMGGYLPLEAFFLVMAVLVFNRFRGVFALVMGLLAITLFAPTWHAAVYARSEGMIKVLPPAAHWLRLAFAGPIETALKSEGRPALLMTAGCLLAFAVGAVPAYLASVALPFLRRRLGWREVAVIFVLLSVGVYSCKSVQWIVGIIVVPYKDDSPSRNFKTRFVRPVPPEQDEEWRLDEDGVKVYEHNPAGVPSWLVPYDPHKYDADTADGARKQKIEQEALRAYNKGWLKRAPQPPKDMHVPRAEKFQIEAGKVLAEGFDARQEAALKGLVGKDFSEIRTQGETYRDYRVVGLEKDAFKIRLKDEAPGNEKTAAIQVRFADLPAGELDRLLASAFRQYEKQYGDEYKQYHEERAEHRSKEWAAFWKRWQGPLRWWLPLLLLIMLLQVFLAALLRRQWCDHEKLMFPHAQVIRALVEGEHVGSRGRRILSSRALWIGMGISMVLFTFQGLSAYFPEVPAPDLHNISLKTFLSERPWKAMSQTLNIQPYLLGISYLLTCEVSMSIWFFALVNQAMRVAASAWGLTRTESWALHGEWPNSDALYTGAMFIFVFWLVWGARRHIWYVLKRGLGMIPADKLEKREPMSYPVAMWGFWLALAGIFLWCVLVGLQLWIMAVIIAVYLILVVLVCRVVSEAGVVTAALGTWPFYPHFVFCHLFGFGQAGAFGKMIAYKDSWLTPGVAGKAKLVPSTVRNFGVFSFIWPSMLFSLQLTPFVLAGFKLTETEPRRKRLLTGLMLAGLLVATFIFLHGTLNVVFERGAQDIKNTSSHGFHHWSWVFNNWLLRDVVSRERMWEPDGFRLSMMGIGGGVMSLLLILRSSFYWWPLHPIGLAAVGAEGGLWVCFLLGWLFKRGALSYGGGEFSRKMNPFFYGLIIGQLLMAAFWAIVGLCGSGVEQTLNILPGTGY